MATNASFFEEKQLDKAYDFRLILRIYPYLKPYRLMLSFSIIMAMAITVLNLSLPYITKIAIDQYIIPKTGHENDSHSGRRLNVDLSGHGVAEIVDRYPDEFVISGSLAMIEYSRLSRLEPDDLKVLRKDDLSGITFIAVIFVTIIIIDFILNFFQQIVMEYTGQKIMHDLRMKLFTHIQDMPVSYFNQNPVARLVTRTTNDVQNMQEMFTSIITFVFMDLFLLAGIAIVILNMSWKLSLTSFIVLPFVIYFSIFFSGRAREAFRIIRTKTAEINTHFSETITGIKVIQLFRQEENNYQKFKKLNHEYYQAGMKQVHVFAIFMPVIELLGIVSVAVVIYYGGMNVISDEITIGVLAAFISYIKMFFRPIRDVAEKYNIMQNAMSSAERLFQIIDNQEKDAPLESGMVHEPLLSISSLEARSVSFGYVKDEPVLKDVSFSLQAGDTIAIVGPTGSGKTTLMNLINRFYSPDRGQILVNGIDIRRIPSEQLRSKMALVTQDPFLFSESIKENILHGTRELSDKEIYSALEHSNCKDLVERLPDGLDTILSEGGASISSGERQLISIARAFARNPELIILDEATSYIDSDTEQKIQKALINLMTNRTSIIIAHRLSTARLAKMILVMKKGVIIESGTHEALMSKRGFYHMLNQMEKIA